MAITAKQPIQIRLSDTELAALDAYRAHAGRFPPDRATVVKQALLDWLWQQAGGGPRGDGAPSTGPALLGLEQATPSPALPHVPVQEEPSMTPLQQVVLAVPSPQAVEAAAAAPVPELESSVDMGTPGTEEDAAAAILRDAQAPETPGPTSTTATQPPATAPHRAKADLIARLRYLHEVKQLGPQAIAERLNAEGVPTISGKGQWSKGTVSKILARIKAGTPTPTGRKTS